MFHEFFYIHKWKEVRSDDELTGLGWQLGLLLATLSAQMISLKSTILLQCGALTKLNALMRKQIYETRWHSGMNVDPSGRDNHFEI